MEFSSRTEFSYSGLYTTQLDLHLSASPHSPPDWYHRRSAGQGRGSFCSVSVRTPLVLEYVLIFSSILVWIGISLVVGWSGILSVVRSALWRPIGQLASRQMDVMACELK